MKDFEKDNCCNVKRTTAADFLMKPMYSTNKVIGYKVKSIMTNRGIIQVLWKKEGDKLDLRYRGVNCLTSKVALEALCEWVCNGEVKGPEEAVKKLQQIRGYKVNDEVVDLVYKVFEAIEGEGH
ncbi:hypothetical protein [Stygiolobus caldivivus]|uniref:Uncharacterized protein n=1 Tax=Stygiolobus caldivivus TaxID=2824673 RepID=A0A8D5U5F3_9CREN|nr:hypothetical protein [Stygiolobus caldivivus]BCU69865.1 hypothetical protein KN1_11620 [Stygiolobus caldivivus]